MFGEILRRLFGQSESSNASRRRGPQTIGHIRLGYAGELLELRRLLSATAAALPDAEADVTQGVSGTQSKSAPPQTIETPLGSVDLTLHTHGTRLRGKAVLTPNDESAELGLSVSPIRFRARVRNLQLEGKLVGEAANPLRNGQSQRFKGKFNVGRGILTPENLDGHLKLKFGGQAVLDQDFNVPLTTLLDILQQQIPE